MRKTLTVDHEIELQQLTHLDATDIFNTIDRERAYLGKWLPFVAYTQKLEDSQKAIAGLIETAERLNEFIFTIKYKGGFVGLIGMKCTDHLSRKTEIGYWLSEKYQKRGIVTKSLAKVIEFSFSELQLNRIQVKCACGNLPSKSIPQRLGFTLEGIEREGELLTDGLTDLEVYSLLKADLEKEKKTIAQNLK